MPESGWYHCLKFHPLVSHWMCEAQYVGMKAQTVEGIVTIAVFHVSAHWMPYIG